MPTAAIAVRSLPVPDLDAAPTAALRFWHRRTTRGPEMVGARRSAPSAEIEFRLLGPLEVRTATGPVELGGPRQRAVLALLLLRANEVVSLDRLVDDLWSGEPPRAAVSTIRGYLSHLRDALGPDVLLTRRPGYVAKVDPDHVDALRFEHLVAEARRSADPVVASTILGEALRLWRGPALVEFADLPCVLPHAHRLEELRLTAIDAFHDAELARGLHADLVTGLRAAVAEQPLRERRWQQLMLAYYRCGRQTEALRAFQQVRGLLADELGLEPGPELVALESAILGQRPGLADGAGPGHEVHATASVGRRKERSELRAALSASQRGQGGLALLSGEAGIGKTHLVAEMAALARSQGMRVAWGHCHDGSDAPPFWPWVEALHGLRSSASRVNGAPGLAQLVGLSSETDPDPADPDARFRLFDAVASVLAAEGQTDGLLLILEDVHWADRPSLLLLEFLGRRLRPGNVLVVATTRTDDMASHDWSRLARVAALPMALGGLDIDEVADFLAARELDAGSDFVARLHQRSGGNPFILRELARLPLEDQHEEGVPPTVRELVLHRCDGLSAGARHLLQMAALIGPRFEFDTLRAVTGLATGSVLDVLDDALARGLIAEVQPIGTYRFVHELVSDALKCELSRHRRAFLHRTIAEKLDADSAPASELARHYCEGIAAGANVTRAVACSLAAAKRAIDAMAYEAAAALCQRALDALAGTAATPVDRVQLLLAAGDACWRAGDVKGARAHFVDAVDSARLCEDPSWLAKAVLGIGGGLIRDWHATSGDCRGQLAGVLQEALRRMGPDDSDLRVRLLGHLAEELYFETGDDRRRSLSHEAMSAARRLGGKTTLGFAIVSRILAVWDPDGTLERRDLSVELLVIADELASTELAFFAHHHFMVAALELGETEMAWRSLDALQQLAASSRLPLHQWTVARLAALHSLFVGDMVRAEQQAVAAFELGEQAQDPDAFNIFATQIGLIRLEQGRADEVVATVDALAAEFPELPGLEVGRCLLRAEAGQREMARAELTTLCADDVARLPNDFSRLAALAMLTEACASLDDRDAAGVIYRRLLPYRQRNILAGDRHCWGSSEHYLGVLAATMGDSGLAACHFEAALAANAGMGARPWLAHTQAAYGRLLDSQGDQRAKPQLREARATARALGLTRVRRRLG